MKVTINKHSYSFLTGYRKDDHHRTALNNLVHQVFGLSFEDWYQQGYWREKYIPYTLFDSEKAVANVSVNIMDFHVLGKKQRYIQLGTVATDEVYRNRQLSRFLMERVLEDWNHQCNLIYLYANDTVLEMYPKFGFIPVKEYEYFKSIRKNSEQSDGILKLDMHLQSSKDLVYQYAKNSFAYEKISMQENADLIMFYCTSFLKDHVYYIQSLNVIAVAKFDETLMHLWGVFSINPVDLETVINKMAHAHTEKVVLGFTPHDCSTYEMREFASDETLFIQKDKIALFHENKMMFPLLSHA